MTVVRHLVVSDVRRFRWPMVALMTLMALSTALDGYLPELAIEGQARMTMEFVVITLWLVEGLLTALVIARLVQRDRLVGTTAFWMTRPIEPMRLFAAKGIVIGAVAVIWPVLCEIVLMAFHHVPAGQIVLGAVQDVGGRALLVLAVMSAAAITAGVTQFFVLCGSVAVAAAVATIVHASLPKSRYELVGGVALLGSSAMVLTARAYYDHTADILRVVMTVAALVALLVVQYRSRSVRRAVVTGLGGAAIALGIAQVGPDSFVAAASRPPEWAREQANPRLGVESRYLSVEPTAEWGLPTGAMKVGVRAAHLAGVAPGYLAGTRVVGATMTLADGSTIESVPNPRAVVLPEEAYGPGQQHVIKDVLGVRSIGDEYASGGSATLFVARREDVPRLSSGPVSYRGRFEIDLTRVTVAGVIPLRRGATFQDGSYRLVVGDIAARGGALVVGVRTSELQSVFDRHVPPSYAFFLRNSGLSEAAAGVLLSDGRGHTVPFLFGLHLYRLSSAGFAVRPGHLQFRARGRQAHVEDDLSDAWLKGAELVVLKSHYEGTVERTLTLDNLTVSPPRR